jgi:hypothetical protein
LGLEEHGDGWVVEPREEDKIDDISDVLIDFGGQIENKTGGIRYIPTRNKLNHEI